MSDDAQRWKEKYLQSIEQQEKLERRWDARLDLLRRGLVRSSLAAEGADKAVDQCMKEMREVVRKDDMDAGLSALIPRLEKAVLDSEQRREQRIEQMGAALTALVAQLQTLPLPRDVSKPLKQFAKTLEDRVTQARELPLLLSELSELQGQAFLHLEHPEEAARPGIFQRLFGSREAAENEAPAPVEQPAVQPASSFAPSPDHRDAPPAQPVSLAAPVPTARLEPESAPAPAPAPAIDEASNDADGERTDEPGRDDEGQAIEQVDSDQEQRADVEQIPGEPSVESDLEQEPAAPSESEEVVALASVEDIDSTESPDLDATIPEGITAESESADEDGPYSLPSSPEPAYSSVATHIEQTLLGLLNDLTLPEHHRPQAQAMRERLQNGLNWYELLPILDDLAVLMLAITDSGQHEFERYLKQLNERLESFQSNLQAASEDHADQQSASRQLDDKLREHVGGLQSSVQEAVDLNGLKHVLESRLEGLLGTMDQHQQERDQREQEVAARLQSLVGRVATMEQEALGFRAHLEEQRQKALIDTLTGLPNRAAWNERLDQEIETLHKHRSSLLLGILDLDHFKRINDGYGHLAGDKVLKIVAAQLKKRLRRSDFIARFGGEEFVVLLPQTSLADGLAVLEQLRMTIEQCPFHFKGEPVTITVSMGITIFKPGERSDLVLKRADEALYRAKGNGRNRIEQG